MTDRKLSHLPWYVLYVIVAAAAVAIAVSATFGWLPRDRDFGFTVVIIFLGILLAALALASILSGNTLMHHFRTGTVQRDTSPVTFWCIVIGHIVVAVFLLYLGFARWTPK